MKSKAPSVTATKLPIPVQEEPKSIRVTLDLTKTEAEDILRMCERIGGSPSETRGVFDQLAQALSGLNIEPTPVKKCYDPAFGTNDGFHFLDRRHRDL